MADAYFANQLTRFRKEGGELLAIVSAIMDEKTTPETFQRPRLKFFHAMISRLTLAITVEQRQPYETLLQSTAMLLKNTAQDKRFVPDGLNSFAECLTDALNSIDGLLHSAQNTTPKMQTELFESNRFAERVLDSDAIGQTDTVRTSDLPHPIAALDSAKIETRRSAVVALAAKNRIVASDSTDIETLLAEIKNLHAEKRQLKNELKESTNKLISTQQTLAEASAHINQLRKAQDNMQERLSSEIKKLQHHIGDLEDQLECLKEERAQSTQATQQENHANQDLPSPNVEQVNSNNSPSQVSASNIKIVEPPLENGITDVAANSVPPSSSPLDRAERMKRIMAVAYSKDRRTLRDNSSEPNNPGKDKEI